MVKNLLSLQRMNILKKEHLGPRLLTSAAAQRHTAASYTIWRRVMEQPLTPHKERHSDPAE